MTTAPTTSDAEPNTDNPTENVKANDDTSTDEVTESQLDLESAENNQASETQTDTTTDQPTIDPQMVMPNVEVILMTADKALSAGRIADALGISIEQGGAKPITEAVDALNTIYEETGRTFRIERVAGGFRLMTLANFAETIAKQKQTRASTKLSQAALETLAIVAYRQPLTRADIEVIRGVACGEVLRSLLERHLIKIAGRADEVGRPMLYGTTRYFLEVFGMASLKDLPAGKELQQP